MDKRNRGALRMSRRMMAWWFSGPTIMADNPFVWRPPTNVYETEGGLLVQVEVAGLAPDDFRVTLRPSRLTVAGIRRPAPGLGAPSACLQVEIAGGSFRSDVDIPWPVDPDSVSAAYRQGFILVELRRLRGVEP